MISITTILKNVKNLIPYFILIGIYFFFVNLEASRNNNYNKNNEIDNKLPYNKNRIDETSLKIKIPVIPYNQ